MRLPNQRGVATATAAAVDLGLGRQDTFDLVVHSRDDVRGHQAIAHALAGVSPGTHRRVDRTGFAAHQHGDVTAAHKLR